MIRMKVRASVKKISPDDIIVGRAKRKRGGKKKITIYVKNKLKRKHNQRQG